MRVSHCAYIVVAITTIVGAAYPLLNDEAQLPNSSPDKPLKTEDFPLVEKPDRPPVRKEEARLREDDLLANDHAPDLMPSKQDHGQSADLIPAKQNLADHSADLIPPKQDFSYLTYYAYSEVPPDTPPADTVLESLKGVPAGRPIEEIKRASDAFGLDFNFMTAVAKIESDFDPKQRTGSYIGLFQLSNTEFRNFGSGDILNARDNAIAAAYKFTTEAILFELSTHKKPTLSDIYLIHQQGVQGAAEHVSHPDWIAWKSMCATDEGREKGEKWCKRAIWANTLPEIKHVWKSVENLTSGAFVKMWQDRVHRFYTRYSEATTTK
jgi:hypothetical protein